MSDTELSGCDYESDSDLMDDLQSRRQLLSQITELQSAVDDMKSAFTMAIQRLTQVPQEDQNIWNKVEENKNEIQTQISEVLKMMLSMKADFTSLKTQVQQSQDSQQNLKRQIQELEWERNILVEELHKSGSVSDQMWYNFSRNTHRVGRASSGTHSNDSGVVSFQSLYHPPPNPSLMSSDQESALSILDNPLMVSHAMVHDYVTRHSQSQVTSTYERDGQLLTAYDSDSSLVNAANKSLTLTTSLGKQCGLELDQCQMSECAGAGDSETEEDDDDDDDDNNPILESKHSRTSGTEEGKDDLKTLNGVYNANENSRLRLAKEVLESERKYCSMLHTLLRTFAEPLIKTGILSIKDVNTLFPDEINQLYFKHCTLCHMIEEKIQSWICNSTLGDVFDKFTDPLETNVLQLYTSYIDDFPEVLKTFHKLCRKSTKFTQFLKSCLNRPDCGGLDLGVFLVAPVQRIPQYILLLKNLLKVVDKGHADVVYINSCLLRLKDSLNRLNDTMQHSFQLISAQIKQEDVDNIALSGWSNKSGSSEANYARRRISNSNLKDESYFELKRKGNFRGCRTSAREKEEGDNFNREHSSGDDSLRIKPNYRSVQSQTQVKSGNRNSEDSNKNSSCNNKEHADYVNGENPETKNGNNQRDVETSMKPVKSKPPVKPCRYRSSGKVSSDLKLEASSNGSKDKSVFVETDVPNLRCNAESIASSEPNLAQEQQEVSLDCSTRATPYKFIEKGSSLGCIAADNNEDLGRIPRPLGKAESSYTIHHVTVPSTGITSSKSIPVIVSSTSGITPPQIKQKTAPKAKTKDKKLVSIRASLKNILTFRKRGSDASHKDPDINNIPPPPSKEASEAGSSTRGMSTAITIPGEVQSQICIILRRDDDVDDSSNHHHPDCRLAGDACCTGSNSCSTV